MRLRSRALIVAASIVAALAAVRPGQAQETPAGTTQAPAQPTVRDPEAEPPPPAAVTLDGETILWVTVGAGPYTAQFRADRVSQRLVEAIRDRSLRDPTVTIQEAEGASELRAGSHLLLVLTARDAASIGAPRASLAEQYARILETAIREERLRYAPATLFRSGIYGVIATLLFGAIAWIIIRVTGGLRAGIARRIERRAEALHLIHAEGLTRDHLGRALSALLLVVRVALILVFLDLYLTYVLGLFPWTRGVSTRIVGYAFSPIRAVVVSVIGYLPKLLFLVVIAGVITLAIRLVRAFFRQIEDGHLVFEKFPPEWADPTNKIARVLLIAFGLVVAFPYLPASNSPAFAGVSVFIGVLVSLSSSSALSNMIAGIVLTYTGAFRIGDRVKVGDAFGDIVKTSLLATHVRTIKNEDITIPNSIALGSAVINYTREAKTRGLILHTSVTIGYDTPWRKIHQLLIEAALATPGILAEPRPFVWQTALNDFYVTYEINAYTATPAAMIDIYAALHSNIQDAFFAAGVEIMSPHYTSIRDGNTVSIPEAFRAADYRPASFRIQSTTPGPVPAVVNPRGSNRT